MIIDFRTWNSQLILNSLVDDDDYNERICELVLHGWGIKKCPCNIIPGVWEHGSPYGDLVPVAEEKTKIANLLAESISVPPSKYAWWFTLFSDSIGVSIDFIYPYDDLISPAAEQLDKEIIVYGIATDLSAFYINFYDTGLGDDWLAYSLLESAVKHWCMKQIL